MVWRGRKKPKNAPPKVKAVRKFWKVTSAPIVSNKAARKNRMAATNAPKSEPISVPPTRRSGEIGADLSSECACITHYKLSTRYIGAIAEELNLGH